MSYTQDDLNRYIELRRQLDGFNENLGLRLDLARAKQKLNDHNIGNDLKKFLNRPPEYDADAEKWVKINTQVSEVQKEIKELESKIIFHCEASDAD